MNFLDLDPKESSFVLNETEYKLRPFCLADEIWLQREYGSEIAKVFGPEKIDMFAVTRIVFHQLVDKGDFKKTIINEVDENGNETKKEVGGHLLFLSRIIKKQTQADILSALTESIGMSRGLQEEGSEEKKTLVVP